MEDMMRYDTYQMMCDISDDVCDCDVDDVLWE